MRKFKFRAWDRYMKEYVHIQSFDASDGQISTVIDTSGINGDIPGEWDLELCTGLHDKDGNEVYEGDIMSMGDHETSTLCVEWDSEHAGFAFNEPRAYMGLHESTTSYYKIIGNIHENPELLEANQ